MISKRKITLQQGVKAGLVLGFSPEQLARLGKQWGHQSLTASEIQKLAK